MGIIAPAEGQTAVEAEVDRVDVHLVEPEALLGWCDREVAERGVHLGDTVVDVRRTVIVEAGSARGESQLHEGHVVGDEILRLSRD